jgi:NADPH-dependent curcumin reductase CurA
MRGFVILDHCTTHFDDFRRDITEWIAAGRVKLREHVVDGLENAPAAFIGLLEGRNFGKLVVRVSD